MYPYIFLDENAPLPPLIPKNGVYWGCVSLRKNEPQKSIFIVDKEYRLMLLWDSDFCRATSLPWYIREAQHHVESLLVTVARNTLSRVYSTDVFPVSVLSAFADSQDGTIYTFEDITVDAAYLQKVQVGDGLFYLLATDKFTGELLLPKQ